MEEAFRVVPAGLAFAGEAPGYSPIEVWLRCLERVDSTQLEAKRGASWYHSRGVWLIRARHQTHGYGRKGSRWISDPNGNVYVTCVVRDPHALSPGLMSLWLAYQLKTVLADFLGGSDILMVKWPNDVCKVSSDGVSKVGGMLLERVDGYLYCGVGINATAAPPLAIEPGDLPAGCFEMDGERVWERVQACLLRFAATLIQQSSEHCEATAVDAVRGVEADMLGSLNRVTWFQKEGGGLTPMVPLEIVIPSGGLRVKTQEGERLLLKGSITGSVCVSPSS